MRRLKRAQSSLGVETFAFDPADNLLKEHAGTHYAYDERGNLCERTTHGTKTVFGWDSFNRMMLARTQEMDARYLYDALGRRIAKVTEPQLHAHRMGGRSYAQMERQRLKSESSYGFTLYGWDGDTLAYETSWEQRETTHYVYEPGSFTPLALATGPAMLDDGDVAASYYHCDQIGTPLEVSDESGTVAWFVRYKAWGKAREVISKAARKQ